MKVQGIQKKYQIVQDILRYLKVYIIQRIPEGTMHS